MLQRVKRMKVLAGINGFNKLIVTRCLSQKNGVTRYAFLLNDVPTSILQRTNTTFSIRKGYIFARHIGWFIVTTGMITALPLIFEVRTYHTSSLIV